METINPIINEYLKQRQKRKRISYKDHDKKLITNGQGYVLYRKSVNGKIEHVSYAKMLMENLLKRPLNKDELILHLDGDTGNNDISNLQVISNDVKPLDKHDIYLIKVCNTLQHSCVFCRSDPDDVFYYDNYKERPYRVYRYPYKNDPNLEICQKCYGEFKKDMRIYTKYARGEIDGLALQVWNVTGRLISKNRRLLRKTAKKLGLLNDNKKETQ